ncbi:hypothetical protein [Streptosporangium oxazolinicum]|uniref:hypothetical protein n=1 Tax=Streptosporangium oxazolinicum TaxID=909287 RepID=UPI0031ED5CC2
MTRFRHRLATLLAPDPGRTPPPPSPSTPPSPSPSPSPPSPSVPIASPPAAAEGPGSRSVAGLWETVSALGGLLTVGAALLVYFGWVRTATLSDYLGFDDSLIGMSIQDYMLRSVNVLFGVFAVVIGLALGAFRASALLRRSLADRPRRARLVRGVLASAPGSLPALAWSITRADPGWWPLAGPCSFTLGLVSLCLALSLPRARDPDPAGWWRTPTGVLLAFLLILGVFWSAGRYAEYVGRANGAEIARELSQRTSVVLYSARNLQINVQGVRVAVLGDPPRPAATPAPKGDGPPELRFRYTGLRLLARSGDRLLLLPDGWTYQRPRLIVVRDDENVRLDYGRWR